MVSIINLIKYIVIIGDVAYILFLLYNGIDEGLKFNVQSIAPIGMIFLLILNIFLLVYLKKEKKDF